jgi:hypothetical protein
MVSTEDPRYVWVCASGELSGDGTRKSPFGRIKSSLVNVQSGQVIVLLGGTYQGDVTFEACGGSMEMPLRIVADDTADASKVIVNGSCWYFYDVSDLIVSGIAFKDSPLGSIAMVGACARNRFEYLKFENCCARDKASCSLFFGGSGASCNIVEQCTFERPAQPRSEGKKPDDRTVGIMISEGDAQEGTPIIDHVIRKNRFVNYDYGILVGTDDATEKQYGHLIEYNTVDNCVTEGIMVKCGDTQVRGNTVRNCRGNSISVVAGEGTVVEDNRILDCGTGIRVAGKGHTVANNCIVRCGEEAIRAMDKIGKTGIRTQNLFIEKNTCVAWSQNRQNPYFPGISIAPECCAVVQKNLFLGPGKPYNIESGHTSINACKTSRHYILDNYSAAHTCEPASGMSCGQVIFSGIALDNYENNTGYGAEGWVVKPEPFDPDKEADMNPVEINELDLHKP